jgi:hypothetical protein
MTTKIRERVMGKGEVWTKRCPDCLDQNWPHFIPDDYRACDDCVRREYLLEVRHDALDHLGLVDLCTMDSAIRAIRSALMETYVTEKRKK